MVEPNRAVGIGSSRARATYRARHREARRQEFVDRALGILAAEGLDGLPRGRAAEHEGPAVVLTLGRAHPTRLLPFLKASAAAEGAVVGAPGMLWTSGLAKPPFVATCSVWESLEALSAYAYGTEGAPHPGAIAADRAKPFHRQSAFIRFRPLSVTGRLDGANAPPGRPPHRLTLIGWCVSHRRGGRSG